MTRHDMAAGICLSALLVSQQALAQEAEVAPEKEAGALQEIVVTAQKRAENLQKVPIAITAIGGDQLAQSGIQGTQALAAALPGLQLLNIGGNVTPRVRGVGSGFTAAGIESPVATYVDGVYYAFGGDVNMDLFDVQQVSLIKGPQGTLFGRNATGGVLQITTRDPEFNFNGRAGLGFDEYQTIKGDIFLTGGLSDRVAASFAASYTHQGKGWGKNLFTGNDTYKTDHAYTIRGKIRAEVTDTTTIRISGDYSDREGPMATNFRPFPGTDTAYPAPQPKRLWDNNSYYDSKNAYSGGGVSMTIDQELGDMSLTSITAYRDAKQLLSFTPVPTTTPVFDIVVNDASKQFTQEFQLSSGDAGPLTWQVGAYYFYNKATRDQIITYHPGFGETLAVQLGLPAAAGSAVFPFVQELIPGEQKLDSLAAYAQATYKITDTTRFTAGFRYTWQWTKFSGTDTLILPDGTPVVAVTANNLKSNFKKPTWRLALDHDFMPNVTGFISWNRGVKSGGFNMSNPANLSFLPENLDAYEAGVKSELLDRRVRLNLSGFYYKYDNIQVPAFNSVLVITNGAKAELYGADVELLARATDQLTLNASANWLHAKFQSFPGATFTNRLPSGMPDLGFPGDASGSTIPYSPKFTYTVGATYAIPSSVGEFALNVNDSYNSGFYSEADNFLRQKSYHFLNASISWTSESEAVTARVYVNNILNEAAASQFPTIAGYAYIADYTNPPRIVGGSIQLNF